MQNRGEGGRRKAEEEQHRQRLADWRRLRNKWTRYSQSVESRVARCGCDRTQEPSGQGWFAE